MKVLAKDLTFGNVLVASPGNNATGRIVSVEYIPSEYVIGKSVRMYKGGIQKMRNTRTPAKVFVRFARTWAMYNAEMELEIE
jgi:hypothetical protein